MATTRDVYASLYSDEGKNPLWCAKHALIRLLLKKGYMVFGGAVRDLIAGVEPTDVDVYVRIRDLLYVEGVLTKFEQSFDVPSIKLERLNKPESDVDWTTYLGSRRGAPHLVEGAVVHYKVTMGEGYEVMMDVVLHTMAPCYGHLDCIVNGLCLEQIPDGDHEKLVLSFDSSSKVLTITCYPPNGLNMSPEEWWDKQREDNLALVIQWIKQRKAGILEGCAGHRKEKIIQKGYESILFTTPSDK